MMPKATAVLERNQLDFRHLRTSSNPACVNHIVRPSTGCAQEENFAITILLGIPMEQGGDGRLSLMPGGAKT
jgi:hypothetical protein